MVARFTNTPSFTVASEMMAPASPSAYYGEWTFGDAHGQVSANIDLGSTAIKARHILHSLIKLKTVCNVWSVAPHPDDEDHTLLRGYALNGATVGILSLTQGEGGGNKAGPQLGTELSSIRRYELQRAAEVAGASEVQFLDFPDFFAKNIEEVKASWGERLPELVNWIRATQPDVIILRFRGSNNICEGEAVAPGDDGAAHTYATDMMLEAVRLAKDSNYQGSGVNPEIYDVPSVILTDYCPYAEGTAPTQYQDGYGKVITDGVKLIKENGESVDLRDIGPKAAKQHFSQFGGSEYDPRGGREIYLKSLNNSKDAEPDIITKKLNWSWSRFEGGARISAAIDNIITSFNPNDLSGLTQKLQELHQQIIGLNLNNRSISQKLKDLDQLLKYISPDETPTHKQNLHQFPDAISFTPYSNVHLLGRGNKPHLRGTLRNHTQSKQRVTLLLRNPSGETIASTHLTLSPGKVKRISIPIPAGAEGAHSWHIRLKGGKDGEADSKPALTCKRFAPPFRSVVHIEPAQTHLINPWPNKMGFNAKDLPQNVAYLHNYDGLIPQQLRELGINVKRLDPGKFTLKSLKKTDLLIIGRDFIGDHLSSDKREVLETYLKSGGRLLILEQMRKIYGNDSDEGITSLLPQILRPKEARITTDEADVKSEDTNSKILVTPTLAQGARALVSTEDSKSTPLITLTEGGQTGIGVAQLPYGIYCGLALDRHLSNGLSEAWGLLLTLMMQANAHRDKVRSDRTSSPTPSV